MVIGWSSLAHREVIGWRRGSKTCVSIVWPTLTGSGVIVVARARVSTTFGEGTRGGDGT